MTSTEDFNKELSVEEKKILWLVGAMDRLVNLGIVKRGPVSLTAKSLDAFNEVDTYRDALFESDEEVTALFLVVAVASMDKKPSELTDEQAVNLLAVSRVILEYKNNRQKVERAALELMVRG